MTEINGTAAAPAKPPKHRSPSYPAYDLEAVVGRAKALHDLAGVHAVNISTVVQKWGYSIKSSKGSLMISALKKYGLAEDKGKGDTRVLGLTQAGRELVYYDADRGSDDWQKRAQIAALHPSIHRELWQRYGGQLPTDSVIKDYLVLDRGFSEAAAVEAIGALRRTLAFAGITAANSATISLPPEGEPSEEESEPMASTGSPAATTAVQMPSPVAPPAAPPIQTPAPSAQTAPVAVDLLLSENGWAKIQTSGRLSEDQWNQLMDVLKAMKPGFLRA